MWKAIAFYWLGFAIGSVNGRNRCEQYYYEYYNSKKIAHTSKTITHNI